MEPRKSTRVISAFYFVVIVNCLLFVLYYSHDGALHFKPSFNHGFSVQSSWTRYLLVKEGKLNETCTMGVSKQPHVNMTDVKRSNLTDINRLEVKAYVEVHCLSISHICNATCVGKLPVDTTLIQVEKVYELYEKELKFVKYGGWWSPEDCIAKQHTAIIIPFRNRYQHLPVLLRHLHPILKRQRLHYRIFVVEQEDGGDFNKGKLMNLGYKEALKIFPYSCLVFNDVDMLPEDDRIMYSCAHSPKHLSAAVSTFNYSLPYPTLFGGVTMYTPRDFRRHNGFSNLFWSYGGEDDNMNARTNASGMKMYRESMEIGRYKMLSHVSTKLSRNLKNEYATEVIMSYALKYRNEDGLNSLNYKLNEISSHHLYTKIKVGFIREKDKNFGVDEEIVRRGFVQKRVGQEKV